MDFVVWLVIGAFIGWLASVALRTDAQQGALLNVALGVAGSLIGGLFLAPLLGIGTIREGDFGIASLFISLLGAVVLLMAANLLRRRRS